jgi:hypothetical protein
MGNQCSETHDQHRNQPPYVPEVKEFVPNPQGFVYNNHHTDGPSKVSILWCGYGPLKLTVHNINSVCHPMRSQPTNRQI